MPELDNRSRTPPSPRRGFLKASAATVGMLATGGLAVARSAHAAGDETLKVGLIGCGGRGSGAAVNALAVDAGAKLTAMADAFDDRLEGSLERIKKAKPDQVAVDAPSVRAVLAAREEARGKGLSIVSGLCWRYHHGVRETMSRVLDGAVGRIVAIQETYNCGPPWFRNNQISDHFFGTEGHCDVLKHRIEGKTEWRYEGPKCNMYEFEHEELFTSIRGAKPINDGLFMARSTMLAILGRMVTYTGQAITWDQAIHSTEDLSPARYAWDADPPILPDDDGKYSSAVPGVTKSA